MNLDTFFTILFDDNESTCFSSNPKGTSVYGVDSISDVSRWALFFTINPLHPKMDLNPTETYHNPSKPRRADHNVVSYRNILVEMDSIPLDDQEEFIETIGLPYSTSVYSGGKSIHYIISLKTPLTSEIAYRKLVDRVYKALGGKQVVDTSCRNPSRLSRFPEAVRADKDNEVQILLETKTRVSLEDLETWLLSKGVLEVEEVPAYRQPTYTNMVQYGSNYVNSYTLYFITMGAPVGQRNSSLFKAACNLYNCGYTEDQIIDKLSIPSGLEEDEILRTINSAIKKVNKSNP